MWTFLSWRPDGRRARRLALAVACAVLPTGPARAQHLRPPIPPLDTHVRVLLRDSTRAHGRLIATTPDAVSLRRLVGATDPEILDRTIPLDSIVTMWRQAGTRWRVGAVVGACVATLGLYAAARAGTEPGQGCDAGCVGGTVAILGAAAGVGAVLGGLIGHQLVRWAVAPP